MRRSLATIFILIYSLSFTEFHQALKLPLLLNHYQEHSTQVDMTFVEFLIMHYETDVAHDDTDMRLPFKNCGHSQAVQTIALLLNQSLSLKEVVTVSGNNYISFNQQIFPSLLSHDIFQPPRA